MAALEKEGIPLTAGQRTGSKPLQWTESNAIDMPLVGGQAARMQDRTEVPRSHRHEPGLRPAELAARGVPERRLVCPTHGRHTAQQSLSDDYTRLTQAPFVTNPQFQNRMTRAQAEYERLVLPHNAPANVEEHPRMISSTGWWPGRAGWRATNTSRSAQQIGTTSSGQPPTPKEKAALIEYKRASG